MSRTKKVAPSKKTTTPTAKQLAMCAAAASIDYTDRKPGRNAPAGHPLSPLVVAYWDSWNFAVRIGVAKLLTGSAKVEFSNN